MKYCRKKSRFVLTGLVCLLAAASLIGCEKGVSEEQGVGTNPQSDTVTVDQESTPGQIIQFPYILEDGGLEVSSLFQYTGINPDCGDEMGEDIAALTVINISNRYLSKARFSVSLKDGTSLEFEVEDVPAGQTAWVFETANTAYADPTVQCVSVTCTAQFEETAPAWTAALTVDVQETDIILTNSSDKALADLTVVCHCLFDGVYFGGRTYAYSTDSIPAGGSVTLRAEDCYLGQAAVVRIACS